MTINQSVDLTIRLPVEVFRVLQHQTQADPASPEVATATEAMLRAIKREPSSCFRITINIYGKKFEIWVDEHWLPVRVWEELKKVHSVKQAGRSFTHAGESLKFDEAIGEVN